MDLEFDKEIDAMIRREAKSLDVHPSIDQGNHLDADAVSAFAENAVPRSTRVLYTAHFADCDHCRSMLSNSISMNAEFAVRDSPATAKNSADAVVPTTSWVSSLLRRPVIAMVMGAIVLGFSGILGYLVIQNYQNEAGSQVSMATEPELRQDDRSLSAGPSNTATNSASNVAIDLNPSNSLQAQTSETPDGVSDQLRARVPDANSKTVENGITAKTERENAFEIDGASSADSSISSPASPPPPMLEAVRQQPNENKPVIGLAKEPNKEDKLKSGKVSDDEDRYSGVTVPPAAKKMGPARSAGPRKDRAEEQSATGNSIMLGSSSTRSAAGKRFDLRSGVWYDISYHGQKTKNFRRGTSEYNKLDGGLRNIADSIGGTVVVVWKSNAYRIQ